MAISAQKAHVCFWLITPVTRGRCWVRGLSRSKGRSASRLKAMANERAAIMPMVRKIRLRAEGTPRAAKKAPAQA